MIKKFSYMLHVASLCTLMYTAEPPFKQRRLCLTEKKSNLQLHEQDHIILTLHEAAERGAWDVVQVLLKSQSADPYSYINSRDRDKKTALHVAAIYGHKNVAQQLIGSQALIDPKDYWERTPLHYAAMMGNYNIILKLVASGADVNARSEHNWTPLHWAVASNHPNIAQYLIKHNAIINASSSQGYTPLHIAVLNGYGKLTKLLLALGADLTAKSNNNETPLQLAQRYEQEHIVTFINQCINNLKQ